MKPETTDMEKEAYEAPAVASYTEAELAASIDAFGSGTASSVGVGI